MHATPSRRGFLRTGSGLGLGIGLGATDAIARITPAFAASMAIGPEAVQFRPEIEPVVRWIEETPRESILDRAVEELEGGLPYRSLLAGLFLAGIRNIKPRPVGFKFHAVMVINSAHLLGQTAPYEDRLLPIFWALDYFKSSQEQDVKEGDWALGPADEARLPDAARAEAMLVEAFDAWDADAADAATSALCRSAGAGRVMEPYWRCAVRDWRNIGHKPIFAMQCWRTLQAIGWEHAEPVLRSLSFGMLDAEGDSPEPEGPYHANLGLARSLREGLAGWSQGHLGDRTAPGCDPDRLAGRLLRRGGPALE